MLNAIVTYDTNYRNFDFSDLTSDERAEYNTWADEANQGTRNPQPEDFNFPIDDPIELANNGWKRIFSECSPETIEAVEQMSTALRAKVIIDQIRYNLASASLNRTIARLTEVLS